MKRVVNETQSNNKIKKTTKLHHQERSTGHAQGGMAGMPTAKACRLTIRELDMHTGQLKWGNDLCSISSRLLLSLDSFADLRVS